MAQILKAHCPICNKEPRTVIRIKRFQVDADYQLWACKDCIERNHLEIKEDVRDGGTEAQPRQSDEANDA